MSYRVSKKLDPSQDALYCQALKGKNFSAENAQVWFSKKVIGVNYLGNFMKEISKRLHLSREYTNHSIRATGVTLLTASGIESRRIMFLTGHKCESSLKSYDSDNNVAQKRQISNILSGQATHTEGKKHQMTPRKISRDSQEHQMTFNLNLNLNRRFLTWQYLAKDSMFLGHTILIIVLSIFNVPETLNLWPNTAMLIYLEM